MNERWARRASSRWGGRALVYGRLRRGAAAAGRWTPSRYDGAAGAYCRRHTLLRVANLKAGEVGFPIALMRVVREPSMCTN